MTNQNKSNLCDAAVLPSPYEILSGIAQSSNGEDWVVNPFGPLSDDSFNVEDITLLKSRYFGSGMKPTLKDGDIMLLKKQDMIIEWGEIYMIQTNDYNIICRPRSGGLEGKILLTYDNEEYEGNGQELPVCLISAIWLLVASQRIHKQVVSSIV